MHTDNRRSGILFGGLALAAWLAAAALPATAEPVTVTFLHVNDVYEIEPKRGKGGFAPLMTLLRDERSRASISVTTFGGDLLSPSVLSGLVQGEQMIELANAVGIDVAVPGNHEFDFGPEVAQARFAASAFPWLAANVRGPDGGPALGLGETRMIDAGGFRIGFFGVIEPETATLSSPGDGVRFEDPVEAARRVTAELREAGADIIVALSHLDLADDRELVRKVEAVDIVLGGHDHDPITFYEGGKLIIKAGYDAHYLAAVDVVIDRADRRGEQVVAWTPQWRYRSTAGVEPDPEIQQIVGRWLAKLDAELGVPVGTTLVELDTRRETVRTRESNFGNLVADAMRLSTGADVAITNGGGIRGDRTYPAGSVLTRKDILTELPFGNVTVLVELTGADLLAALENGVSQVEDKAGRFPQVSGLRFVYDPSKPAGSRVVAVEVGGEPLDPAKTYRVATNDYMAGGGDGYAVLTRGRVVVDASAGTLMATAVMEHVATLGGQISPAVEGRITRIE